MPNLKKTNQSFTSPGGKSNARQKIDDIHFRKLIENSYEGITLLDKDLQIIYRSPSAEHVDVVGGDVFKRQRRNDQGLDVLFQLQPPVRLVAVLDWEMSTIGDPLTDLAHLLVYWEPTRGRITHSSQVIARQATMPVVKRSVGRATGQWLRHLTAPAW